MEQTIRHICCLHNLPSNVFDALARATFYLFTPKQMLELLENHCQKVIGTLPDFFDSKHWECTFGDNAIYLEIQDNELVFQHQTNAYMVYGRTQVVLSYFDIISLKHYISRIPLHLVVKDDSVFRDLEAFVYASKFKFVDTYSSDGREFAFNGSIFRMFRPAGNLTHVELYVPDIMFIMQCIYNVELLEEFKKLITWVTK